MRPRQPGHNRLLKKSHMLRLRSIASREFVFVRISRLRFTDTITVYARLASEIFLSGLYPEFLGNC